MEKQTSLLCLIRLSVTSVQKQVLLLLHPISNQWLHCPSAIMPSSGDAWGSIDVTDRDQHSASELPDVVVKEDNLLEWAVRCLMEAGAEESPARTHASILLSADRRGHYSHGFNRLDIYYNDIKR